MLKPVIGIDATNLRLGGGRTHLTELLRAADPHRDQFHSICVWGSNETLDKIDDRSFINKKAVPELERGLFSRIIWQFFFLHEEVKKARCDVLFSPGGVLGRKFRPSVTMSRNMLPFDNRELLRYGFSWMTLKMFLLKFFQSKGFRRADGVIFLTGYAAKKVLEQVGPVNGLTTVIPHGLNPTFLISEGALAKKTERCFGDEVRIVYVSTVDVYKHQWGVVEGVAEARKVSGLNFKLDLAGPYYPPALRKLQAAMMQHDPDSEWVRYLGQIDYHNINTLYAQAHIGVFASSCENMPNILLETMASGLPVISSNYGPMPEILGNAGLYFDPEQPDTLAKALLQLFSSEDVMHRLAAAALKNLEVIRGIVARQRLLAFCDKFFDICKK